MTRPCFELARDKSPVLLRLTLYGDEAVYSFRENETFSREEHNHITTEVASRLEAAGIMVQLITIRIDEYINWLADNGLTDSQLARSQYAAIGGMP